MVSATGNTGERIQGITGVLLAGGASTRMRSNKALLHYRGVTFIERAYRQLAAIFEEVLVVTNTPELYQFLPCRKVYDVFAGGGSLAGIHAGLAHSATPFIFVAACDMPFLSEPLIRYFASRTGDSDVVIAENERGFEPLHAIYGKGCMSAMEENLSKGRYRIVECFDRVKLTVLSWAEVAAIDPHFDSFRNVNTPQEYQHIQDSSDLPDDAPA